MNMIKLQCHTCNYTVTVPEADYFDKDKCALCGGDMRLFVKEAVKEPEPIQNETEGMNEVIDKQIISQFQHEIEQCGEKSIWDTINTMELETRLYYIELFMEAKRKHSLDK
jgi:hypothetical protein